MSGSSLDINTKLEKFRYVFYGCVCFLFVVEIITDLCYALVPNSTPLIIAQSAIYLLVSLFIGIFYTITIIRILRRLQHVVKMRASQKSLVKVRQLLFIL